MNAEAGKPEVELSAGDDAARPAHDVVRDQPDEVPSPPNEAAEPNSELLGVVDAVRSSLDAINYQLDEILTRANQIAERTSQPPNAVEALRPSLEAVNYQLGELLARANQITEFRSDLSKVVDVLRPSFDSVNYQLGQLLASTNSIAERSVAARSLQIGSQRRFLEFLRRFQPVKVKRFAKTRIGRVHDGGYVMLDDFDNVRTALSCGVGDDASWDLALAGRGVTVHQFDHTIERAPVRHPSIVFHRVRIGDREEQGVETIASLIDKHAPEGSARAVLKLDIEHDEWPVLAATKPGTLGRFSQIVCEFHGFWRIYDDDWLKQAQRAIEHLRDQFEVVHVHGNNAAPFLNLSNVIFPEILEVTAVNRALYEFEESDELFPTTLDSPNEPQIADLHLGAFRF